MGRIIVVVKAILTRVIFATHGFIAIWRVTSIKNDPYYWYLTASILALSFEGIFTLTIKKNQEWKWFCPSVFFYLCSVVPAIWIIEVEKFDRSLEFKLGLNKTITNEEALQAIHSFGVELRIPVKIDAETWATVIEQLLMLILIIGRWMLPKGGLTRDQLSQLLLVYIGTAADIIEFFDSFKDEKISSQRVLCLMILGIWSWSLLQFTFVLTATKSRRTRITGEIKETPPKPKFKNGIIKVKKVCCSIDVWGILINIILQDAPFLIFRMLLITYYKIISYMNIFFTCKNTLVIILQFYRLFVVQIEKKNKVKKVPKAGATLAKMVENAAFMGPSSMAGKGRRPQLQAKPQSGQGSNSKGGVSRKHRSQDSIMSEAVPRMNMQFETAADKGRLKGRRKSLSTGNLRDDLANHEELFEGDIFEDELEVAGSGFSGTNDQDSQDDSDDGLNDNESLASEKPKAQHKIIRLSENPGVYKISVSRSSGASSEKIQYRQDTGYSSSSKESGNSGRRGGVILQNAHSASRQRHNRTHGHGQSNAQQQQRNKRRGGNGRYAGKNMEMSKLEASKLTPAAAAAENERI